VTVVAGKVSANCRSHHHAFCRGFAREAEAPAPRVPCLCRCGHDPIWQRVRQQDEDKVIPARHAARMTAARAFPTVNPERLLALGIISLAADDAGAGREASIDPLWVVCADVSVEWVRGLGIGVAIST